MSVVGIAESPSLSLSEAWVTIPGQILRARFAKRKKRFVVVAEMRTGSVRAFLSHTGRLTRLLTPGAELLLVRLPRREGTSFVYNVVAAWDGDTPVVIDTRLPNKLIRQALEKGLIGGLPAYEELRTEAPLLGRRIDFVLMARHALTYLEVKSCTMSEDDVALFPDAPSIRSTQQLQVLARALSKGARCFVLFLATRPDVSYFKPNQDIDPQFSKALRAARRRGLRVLAYSSYIDRHRFCLGEQLQVLP